MRKVVKFVPTYHESGMMGLLALLEGGAFFKYEIRIDDSDEETTRIIYGPNSSDEELSECKNWEEASDVITAHATDAFVTQICKECDILKLVAEHDVIKSSALSLANTVVEDVYGDWQEYFLRKSSLSVYMLYPAMVASTTPEYIKRDAITVGELVSELKKLKQSLPIVIGSEDGENAVALTSTKLTTIY